MNGDARHTNTTAKSAPRTTQVLNQNELERHWYSIPDPLRRVFDRFPLRSLEANKLPQRANPQQVNHTLFVFTSSNDSSKFNWSCNPTCLKWQTYLLINNVSFVIKPSNNHASPSGSLPFLIPSSPPNTARPSPVVASKIYRWVAVGERGSKANSVREAAYGALVDRNIRDAWLYHLYLDDDNFRSIASPIYVASTSSNQLVQSIVERQLRAAAQEELFKSRMGIERADIYESAGKAFQSLSLRLGTKRFFSDNGRPGLFDASLFAYTHLLLDESLDWKTSTLQEQLREYPNLVQHRNTILAYCLRPEPAE